MKVKDIILQEIQDHQEQIDYKERTMSLWIKDVENIAKELKGKDVELRETKVRMMAEKSTNMIDLELQIKTLRALIKLKQTLC